MANNIRRVVHYYDQNGRYMGWNAYDEDGRPATPQVPPHPRAQQGDLYSQVDDAVGQFAHDVTRLTWRAIKALFFLLLALAPFAPVLLLPEASGVRTFFEAVFQVWAVIAFVVAFIYWLRG